VTTQTIGPPCKRCGVRSYRDRDYYDDVWRCIACARVVVDLTPRKPEPVYTPVLTPTEALIYAHVCEQEGPVTSGQVAILVSKKQENVNAFLRALTDKGLLTVKTYRKDSRKWMEWEVKA
jgi:hypothetical protein